MKTLDILLEELGGVDEKLASASGAAGMDGEERDRLRELLDLRAELIGKAAEIMDTLRGATPEQRERLLRSEESGNSLARQLILAKHVLSQELLRVRQEQRLWGAMSDSGLRRNQTPRRVDVNG